jgi:hypothetical protein
MRRHQTGSKGTRSDLLLPPEYEFVKVILICVFIHLCLRVVPKQVGSNHSYHRSAQHYKGHSWEGQATCGSWVLPTNASQEANM